MKIISAIFVVGLFGLSVTAEAVPILDQQHVVGVPGNNGLELSQPSGQTFTVELSGTLTGLDLQLGRTQITVDTLTMQLFKGATELATKTISPAPSNLFSIESGNFVFLDLLPFNITVSSGDIFSILLTNPVGNAPLTCAEWCWAGTTSNAYAGGTAFLAPSIPLALWDLGFKSYVSVSTPVPEPATLVLFGVGLAGLNLTRQKKKG